MTQNDAAEREWHRKMIEDKLHLLDDPRSYTVFISEEDDPELSRLLFEGKVKLTLADILDEDGNFVFPTVADLVQKSLD